MARPTRSAVRLLHAAGAIAAVLTSPTTAAAAEPALELLHLVRAPPPAYLSPDGRYLLTLVRDDTFGQVETVRVFAAPNTPRAHVIFEQPGDTPLRFLRWRNASTAELEFPRQGTARAYTPLLTCEGEACRLTRAGERGPAR